MRYHFLLSLPMLALPLAANAKWDVNEGLKSVVRINTTRQTWNAGQPWEKGSPESRRSLGIMVKGNQVLTTAEMVADSTYLELESPDGRRLAPAKVVQVDYESNLAVIGLEHPEDKFFDGMKAIELADRPKLGDTLDVYQVEENGDPLMTSGQIQTVDVIPSFLPGESFLTYEVKASLQSAASSFTLPVLRDGKLVGLLTSYDSKEQISDVIATDIVSHFLNAKESGHSGFPSLGINIARTDDINFRKWLKLPEDGGGVYVSNVKKASSAEKAGLKKGDVIVSIDGHEVDRLGYYMDDHYGRLFWGHLVRGTKDEGSTLKLGIIREGQSQELETKLERHDPAEDLLPAYTFGKAPNYLVKGGFIFQELTRPMIQAFGDDRAPLKLLDVAEHPEKYEGRGRRVVFLSGVVPTPATVGYEPLRNLIVRKVNGQAIKDMQSLIAAFKTPGEEGLHSIEFEEEKFSIYLDEKVSTTVDEQLLQRGLTHLSHSDESP